MGVLVMTAPLVSPTMPDTLWVVNKSLLNEKIKEKIAVLGLSPKLALKKLAVKEVLILSLFDACWILF